MEFVIASPSFQKQNLSFLIVAELRVCDDCAEGRKTRGFDLHSSCLRALSLFCRAESCLSWETEHPELGIGANQYRKIITILFAVMC